MMDEYRISAFWTDKLFRYILTEIPLTRMKPKDI